MRPLSFIQHCDALYRLFQQGHFFCRGRTPSFSGIVSGFWLVSPLCCSSILDLPTCGHGPVSEQADPSQSATCVLVNRLVNHNGKVVKSRKACTFSVGITQQSKTEQRSDLAYSPPSSPPAPNAYFQVPHVAQAALRSCSGDENRPLETKLDHSPHTPSMSQTPPASSAIISSPKNSKCPEAVWCCIKGAAASTKDFQTVNIPGHSEGYSDGTSQGTCCMQKKTLFCEFARADIRTFEVDLRRFA